MIAVPLSGEGRPSRFGFRAGRRAAGTAGLCLLIWFALALPLLVPGPLSASDVVNCLDAQRDLVVRKVRHRCEGRILSDAEAAVWRDKAAQRKREQFERAQETVPQVDARPQGVSTGFWVHGDGYLVTNNHAVVGCARLSLLQDGVPLGPARVQAARPDVDLALLKADRRPQTVAAFLAPPTPPDGEALRIVGYPSEGVPRVRAILSSAQIAGRPAEAEAPFFAFLGRIKFGNSGSPVFDESGAVLGIVMAKIDSQAVYRQTGRLPPDLGLAVESRAIESLLAAEGLSGRRAVAGPALDSEAQLAQARSLVVRVDCWRE
ncbi:S1 family peptidase [Algihabitans albus]|uniref:S1 family peptidase n=1 Tax=Algihabitans albus TaxID=2164067 RepID=UPI0013C374C1|nr:serine protease [Algihabitans albus]